MSQSVANLRDSVTGQLPGVNIDDTYDFFGTCTRVARKLSSLLNIETTEGREAITLYDGVIDYPAPTDIFGTSLIDLRPDGISRSITDYNYRLYISDFDRTKGTLPNGNQITFEFRNGTPIMRVVSQDPTPRIELDPMTATTGWTAAGTASSLLLDQAIYYQSPGSLRFALTGAGTGTLTKTISSTDLTNYSSIGVSFLAYRTNSIANLSSIEVRIGSSSANYYSVSTTTAFLGAFLLNQFDLANFNLSGATTVGSPDITKITYLQIRIAHAASITNFWVGDSFIALPSPHISIYETDKFFTAAGGNPSATITANSDTINLSEDAFHIYEISCAIEIAGDQGGTLASGIIQRLSQELNGVRGYRGVLVQEGLIDMYRMRHPTQEVPIIGNWYN